MKGSENINGLKVGFVLEGGYNSTNGKLGQNGGVFGREAMVYVGGDYGTLYAGRINGLLSDGGSVYMTGGLLSTADNGAYYAKGYNNGMTLVGRYDSTLVYKSPVLAGFQVGVQASNVDTSDGSSSGDRYFAAAASYKAGNFGAFLGGEYLNKATALANGVADLDDAFTILGGASYNFGVAKGYVSANYFKNYAGKYNGLTMEDGEGYTVTVSADTPVLGGKLQGFLGYTDGEDKATDNGDFKVYSVGAQYSYNLAKSTKVYVGAGYAKTDSDAADDTVAETYKVAGGIVYYF